MSTCNLKNNFTIRFWLCWPPCKHPRCPQNVACGPFSWEKQKTKLAHWKQNPTKSSPRKINSADFRSSSFLIEQFGLCVYLMPLSAGHLYVGHCAGSWGLKHKWE